ncbi:tRNA (N6-isopentenyl adenosine(37)-C2)-methylthiotransferase MiaB [Thermospira aquatica]|uniref:tRNA-2-methylthio-N(6)-dimethylallyladenosine synthase n=1 Tax=Thermospira aquatica TaxID=2828656 RepID=A0AAX3BB37_9SPIR|nr:tRNA (N6-isopentenyl adenosine(37)-C2)-methylthiotransferase MiaB [Thermospira aquatica]URA09303.1 tRNA (N6-isopentenyl adenosine(37)-C2)-methylthiotransferase MiaB [Thermospira aquatica]
MQKFLIENYGCQMNVAEAESLRHLLQSNGYEETTDPVEADVVIINTCSVRITAEDRVIGRLGFYRGLREETDKDRYVILMGCMAQNRGEEVKDMFPDVVKRVWGTYHKDKILEDLRLLEKGSDFLHLSDYRFLDAVPQSSSPFRAYLPISHGCDNFCSYCIVPHVRGREVHRPFAEIIKQAEQLLESGVKEIILLGQNVNSYQDQDKRFEDVLDTLAGSVKVPRLSFLTSHPRDFRQSMVEIIGKHANISRLIHLPVQSGNNRILSLMNRYYTREDYLEKIRWIRTIPDVEISTDLMVGFPGETEKEYEDTLLLVKEVEYLEAFCYYYNPRPHTPASRLPDNTTEQEKLSRLDGLIKIQREIRQTRLAFWIGKTDTVLIENRSKRDSNVFFGMSLSGIPSYVEGECTLGDIIPVKFTGLKGSGLAASPC